VKVLSASNSHRCRRPSADLSSLTYSANPHARSSARCCSVGGHDADSVALRHLCIEQRRRYREQLDQMHSYCWQNRIKDDCGLSKCPRKATDMIPNNGHQPTNSIISIDDFKSLSGHHPSIRNKLIFSQASKESGIRAISRFS
jgi:hypothetical protein